MLKINPPKGGGIQVSEAEVINILQNRGVKQYDEDLVKKLVKKANGEYQKIGEMPLNVVNDSSASVQVSEGKMKAYLLISSPKSGGYDLEKDQIMSILKNNGVVVGINEDAINEFIDYPVYDKPILIAEGIKVKNGRDAAVEYKFNTSKKAEFQEHNGQVDFRSVNNITNVVVGQILAVKITATPGESGRTVDNELCYAKPGKDLQLPAIAGKNTTVTEDGLSIIAQTNGQVNLAGGKVVVDEVYVVNGDVNLKTGHIVFLGNVIVQGNVEDNFNVTAEGNIEIKGSVGKSRIEAEGDITVTQGIMGKGEAYIRAGKNLYAKFIENVKKVEVGEGVYIQDGIMHSYVDATKEICCVGKRATIVGGDLRAGELVKSSTIGSTSGTETIIEVGIDPKKRQELMEYTHEVENAYKELEQLDMNFNNLNSQKKQMRDKFPPEKEEILNKLGEDINHFNKIIAKASEEIEKLNTYLASLKNKSRVVAGKIVFPQVKVYIKSAMLQIKTEYKKVEFVLENEDINVLPYKDDGEAASGRGSAGRSR